MSDPSRWFDALGSCVCGKPATGILRGDRNQSMGAYCARCAEKRLKKAFHGWPERRHEKHENNMKGDVENA